MTKPYPFSSVFKNSGKLFAVSFLILFMEIFLIRWISTEVRIFAYVSNLVLLACFLGIGVGCYYARREANVLITLGMLALISLSVTSLPFREITDMLSSLSDGGVWFGNEQASLVSIGKGIALTLFLFLMILAVFVPLGQIVGRLFDEHEHIIAAYSINVGGSLIGIWAFNLFSFFVTPPWVWFLCALVLLFFFIPRSKKNLLVAAVAAALILLVTSATNPHIITLWSPYQKLEIVPSTYRRIYTGFQVAVNSVGYMSLTDLSDAFIRSHPHFYSDEVIRYNQYAIPYAFKDRIDSVLIVGAGAGNDAAGALRSNVREIDAVEIDPGIYSIGLCFHPEKPYESNRVRVIVDDARAFFKKAGKKYDVISFGTLDAHTLSSQYNNIRLDHYMYTEESFREAKRLLKEDGILTVSFAAQKRWVGARIKGLLEKVFGDVPFIFYAYLPSDSVDWGTSVFVTGNSPEKLKQFVASHPDLKRHIDEHTIQYSGPVKLTSDDWPYLYIEKPSIPRLYLLIIMSLVVLFVGAKKFLVSGGGGSGRINFHFFFLGCAFLLLEFQNVSKASLLFGSTWIVNSYIISAILFLTLLANIVVRYVRIRSILPVYALLLASVLATYFIPLEVFNTFGYPARSILASLALNTPVFFSGIIFMSSFKAAPARDIAFGSNLIGAALGGLLEPLSFVTGIRSLLLVVFVLYLVSFFFAPGRKKEG